MHKFSAVQVARGTVAAVALAVAPGVSFASFVNSVPDPFMGHSMTLQADGGALVALPGVGPDGTTLYAQEFVLSGFSQTNFVDGKAYYKANYETEYFDNAGNPTAPFSTTLASGTASEPDSAKFVVQYINKDTGAARGSAFETGTFTMTLMQASFYGLTALSDPIETSLASSTQADVEIANNPEGSGYLITYLTSFEIDGQYTFKDTTHQVLDLSDTNDGRVRPTVPVPATALLLLPGVLGIGAIRRRRGAAA
ncbi:MAG: hypothetical protein LJE69_08955 [Thiohalocapsa sp.]|jgi:hypothetical protein|uniref:hypothetical protein n=1 Tax=Thiohalocapsa sp. TaxID=2497641 RepID=UPI0025E7E961|nr:hypothetical protein [Thiohalocapsa sp.]MCG6941367.1 hypothetical protein [Thiohalocapsa sp.]